MNRKFWIRRALLAGAPALAMIVAAAEAGATTFDFTGSVVDYTVPASGVYDIAAHGAQGGGIITPGGLGAEAGGDVRLSAGTMLTVIVGGEGAFLNGPGGGGGGSFVFDLTDGAYLVAAGGGGGGGIGSNGGGGPGLTTTAGGAAIGSGGGFGGVGGSGGAGGVDGGGAAGVLGGGSSKQRFLAWPTDRGCARG
jgi:hypothetical protein